MQSKKQSLIEVTTSTVIGLLGSWVIAYAVMTEIEDRAMASTVTVAGCTLWSLVRGYWIRRSFANIKEKP